eukprot:5521898-Prymnesium_polylepis.2
MLWHDDMWHAICPGCQGLCVSRLRAVAPPVRCCSCGCGQRVELTRRHAERAVRRVRYRVGSVLQASEVFDRSNGHG